MANASAWSLALSHPRAAAKRSASDALAPDGRNSWMRLRTVFVSRWLNELDPNPPPNAALRARCRRDESGMSNVGIFPMLSPFSPALSLPLRLRRALSPVSSVGGGSEPAASKEAPRGMLGNVIGDLPRRGVPRPAGCSIAAGVAHSGASAPSAAVPCWRGSPCVTPAGAPGGNMTLPLADMLAGRHHTQSCGRRTRRQPGTGQRVSCSWPRS